ncbi:hypothetical protein B0T10DRAFT_455895 [Thelonectria olida]|uniref:Uncharacterized protein n=1 Tax=Thelonectria olida TaxID=1576542 RepID=A0A9P8WAM0_9HYPO|nr:hypothetical protein B0T10DRAFT_455895 [Thelonectria olida]
MAEPNPTNPSNSINQPIGYSGLGLIMMDLIETNNSPPPKEVYQEALSEAEWTGNSDKLEEEARIDGEKHFTADSYALFYSNPNDDRVFQEPFRTHRWMQQLRVEVSVLQYCVRILERRTCLEFGPFNKDLDVAEQGFDFSEFYVIAKDFVFHYFRYLATGEVEFLLLECELDPLLDWKHAIWIRMFVFSIFGPQLQELEEPRFVDGLVKNGYLNVVGRSEMLAYKDNPQSLRDILHKVFWVRSTEEWQLRDGWKHEYSVIMEQCRKSNGFTEQRGRDGGADRAEETEDEKLEAVLRGFHLAADDVEDEEGEAQS